jgi:uncharacterized membrane protein
MEPIFQFFDRLHWWQRPLVAVLPVLLATLVLPMVYTVLVRIPMDVLYQRYPKNDRRQGIEHIVYGAGILAVACGVTWLSYSVQVDWLGGQAHLVAIGAFLVGVYELLYGVGIWLFRTGMLGVLAGFYAFGAFCLYGLLHWTLGWF